MDGGGAGLEHVREPRPACSAYVGLTGCIEETVVVRRDGRGRRLQLRGGSLTGSVVGRNGRPCKKNDRLEVGDELTVTLPETKPVEIAAKEIPLEIVYEDEDVAVINKPKGLVVHPAPGHTDDTLVNGLLYAMGDRLSGINGEMRPGIVHRIDKDTSGLLAIAKNDLAHAVLASQLKDHTMARTYEAVVCGNMKEDSGTVDAPIGRHPTDRKKMCVTSRNSKPAVTLPCCPTSATDFRIAVLSETRFP